MSPWLKAGLIGVGILIVFNLVGLFPIMEGITLVISLLIYLVVGLMAADFVLPPRSTIEGARQGSLAAFMASVISGIFNTLIKMARMVWVGTPDALSPIPPAPIRRLLINRLAPESLVGFRGAVLFGGVCCAMGVLAAVCLGGFGGAIFAAKKPN